MPLARRDSSGEGGRIVRAEVDTVKAICKMEIYYLWINISVYMCTKRKKIAAKSIDERSTIIE